MYADRVRWLGFVCLAACSFSPGAPAATSTSDAAGDAPHAGTDGDTRPLDAAAHDANHSDAHVDASAVAIDASAWPCGAPPPPPPTTVAMSINSGATMFTVKSIDVDHMGQLVVGAPGETVSLSAHLDITDHACPQACVDQLEYGFVPGARVGCAFDNTVNPHFGVDQGVSATFALPATPGVYDLRVNIGQNTSCDAGGGDANGWWGSDPGAADAIARVCVH